MSKDRACLKENILKSIPINFHFYHASLLPIAKGSVDFIDQILIGFFLLFFPFFFVNSYKNTTVSNVLLFHVHTHYLNIKP